MSITEIFYALVILYELFRLTIHKNRDIY